MVRKFRNIAYSFDSRAITHYGGLTLFQQFCKSLALKRYLGRHVQWQRRTRIWTQTELFLSHVLMVVAGVGRLENSQTLRYNGALARLMGMDTFPTPRALRAFLLTASDPMLCDLQRAHDRFRTVLFARDPRLYSAILDLDTTALRVFGRQEGAAKGYVPHYPHQRCYSVRLLTEGRTRVTLDGELRQGNVAGATGARDFVASGLRKLPPTVSRSRIRVRADAAFYGKPLVQFLDEEGVSYVIVAKITPPIQNRLGGLRYEAFRQGWAAAEFFYKPHQWKKEARFVAIRRLKGIVEPPTSLFTIRDHAYNIYVTNLDLHPAGVWRFYCGRARQELLIREMKQHYALGKIPTRAFLANRLALEVLLWAFDLVAGFRRWCLPETWSNASLATLRRDLWMVPGCVVRHGRQLILRMPERFAHQEVFRYARKKVLTIKALD